MEWWLVFTLGAGIGVAFNLLDFIWQPVALVCDQLKFSRAYVLAWGAIGGALIIGAEVWLAQQLMKTLL